MVATVLANKGGPGFMTGDRSLAANHPALVRANFLPRPSKKVIDTPLSVMIASKH